MSETDESGEKRKVSKEDLLKPLSVRKVRLKVNKFLMPASRADAVPHYFSGNQVQFLEFYSELLDVKQACEKSGMTLAQVKRCPYLAQEIKSINQAAMFKHRVKSSLGTHFRLMDKWEKEFDKPLATADMKKAAMSTLARMSEAGLRAAGEFSENVEHTGITGVNVIMNFGADVSEVIQVVDVTSEGS